MHVVGLFVSLAIKVDNVVLYLQRLSGQAHAAFHIVFAAVDGARHDAFKPLHIGVGHDVGTSCGIHLVKVLALLEAVHRVEVSNALVACHQLLAIGIHHLVIVRPLPAFANAQGVASGKVEHHDVVQLHMSEALGTLILPLWPLDVALAAKHGQRVLCEGQRERCLRFAGAIAHLRHEEIVACEQRLFER